MQDCRPDGVHLGLVLIRLLISLQQVVVQGCGPAHAALEEAEDAAACSPQDGDKDPVAKDDPLLIPLTNPGTNVIKPYTAIIYKFL